MVERLRQLWRRYLAWRRADVAPPRQPNAPIKKIAADDGDAIRAIHANRGTDGL